MSGGFTIRSGAKKVTPACNAEYCYRKPKQNSGVSCLQYIECLTCHCKYHITCTEFKNDIAFAMMGQKYRELWKCEKCVIPGSVESKAVMAKLAEIRLSSIESAVEDVAKQIAMTREVILYKRCH